MHLSKQYFNLFLLQVNHIFSKSTKKQQFPPAICAESSKKTVQLQPSTNSSTAFRGQKQKSTTSSSPLLPSRIPISPTVPPKPAFSYDKSHSYNSNLKKQLSNEQQRASLNVSTNKPAAAAQQPEPPLGTMSQNDLEKTLLSWCQEATKDYEAVNIKNFTTSWSDGFAFNALINHFRYSLHL